jgi:hypothetical protein
MPWWRWAGARCASSSSCGTPRGRSQPGARAPGTGPAGRHRPGRADLIFAKDLQGRYFLWEARDPHAPGPRAADLLGHTDAEVFPADIAQQRAQEDKEVLLTQKTIHYDRGEAAAASCW